MTQELPGDVTVLFVPGLRDHVEDHWQTHAARALPGSVTIAPLTADRLSRAARVAALDAALNDIEGDVVIAAHSAGCLMVAHWAEHPTRRIRGALLATPADGGWCPIARPTLPFPAIVVASRNDPLGSFERIAALAQDWGATLQDGGEIGHLNPPAGFGPWPEGLGLIAKLAG
ncbi:alpha/beta hydrolase [Chakrabartia godavariana]|nr:alpha/beta hydrolase [Chakrabartia godavariana]